ncbi:MAG: acyl-ACP--UDP-N-acetylglucosamine O-acyltransferase [Cytophagales bacterium]|nr:acyl-ACP--UDP-N-acetylglucosamine O-acyltransferase [Cytophagales bacterium]
MTKPAPYIHPDAKLGKNVIVEPFAYIEADVVIGDNTWIGPNTCIMEGARIGNNCKIFSGAQIAAVPQDLKYEGEKTYAIIGDNTSIREFVTVSRGTKAHGETSIGSNCLLMNYVHIAHDCILGDHCILSNSVQVAGHVEIGDYTVVGGMAGFRQFIKVGAHVMISGKAFVRKDVPPYVSAAREPLGYSGVNALGLRRRGFSNEVINQIQEMYRVIYMSDYNTSKALTVLEKEITPSKERDTIIDFIRSSERGIMKGVE